MARRISTRRYGRLRERCSCRPPLRAERDRRRRERHIRRGDARRDRGSVERRPDREGQVGDQRRNGNYRIADLRPGTYNVAFTLPGFKTFRRDGLRAAGRIHRHDQRRARGRRARRDDHGDRRVAGRRRDDAAKTAVLDREAIDPIPTGRTIQGMAQLMVGVNLSLPDTGGARAMQQTYMSTHGMTTANTTVLVDG